VPHDVGLPRPEQREDLAAESRRGGSTSAESSPFEGGGFGTLEAGMTVRLELTTPSRFVNLHAITAVPFRSAFACAELMTDVLTRAPLAWAARPGIWRMAVPGLGPGSIE
jgi:hypothetical protein